MTGGSDSTAHRHPAAVPGPWRPCTWPWRAGTPHRRSCSRTRRRKSIRRPASCPGFAHSQTALSRIGQRFHSC